MNRYAVFFVLLCTIVILGGCPVTVGTGGSHGRTHRHPSPQQDVTISEMNAASQLSFESGKLNAYQNIASRPNLSAPTQVYLVQRSLDALSFENSKQSLVMTLIKNPGFLMEGKRAILDNLDAFSFESSKQSVLSALNKRGQVPSGYMRDPIQMETTVELQAGSGTGL